VEMDSFYSELHYSKRYLRSVTATMRPGDSSLEQIHSMTASVVRHPGFVDLNYRYSRYLNASKLVIAGLRK
jgi:hypothetical protein